MSAALMMDALWRPALLAAAVWLVLRVFRVRHPAVQHAVWVATMAGMLAVVPLSEWLPRWERTVEAPAPAPVVEPVELYFYPPPAVALTPPAAPMEPVPTMPWELRVYLWGVTLLLAYWGAGWALVRRIRVRSRATGLTAVRESDDIAAPVTVGLVRRRVLLPADWRAWPRDMRHAVLAHELAHIRRYDAWTLLLSRVVRVLLWFQPAAWFAGHRVAALAESACDAEALRVMRDPARYAEILLGFVARVSERRLVHGLGMAHRAGLAGRIDRIFTLSAEAPRRAVVALFVPVLCVAAGMSVGTRVVIGPQAAMQLAQAPPQAVAPPSAGKAAEEPLYIEGTVRDAATKGPIEGAFVLLEPEDGRKRPYKTVTGADGKWRAEGIEPEKYQISIHHARYPRSYYQQKLNRPQGSRVELRAERPVSRVDFELQPFGVISGRVLDENRRPLAGVILRPMTLRYSAGSPAPQMFEEPQGGGATDDRGEFRGIVPPGRYYLRASVGLVVPRESIVARGLTPPPELPLREGENYVATYYPGTTDTSAAVAIEVTGGQVQAGINFTLRRWPTATIRGRVVNETGSPIGNTSVRYWPAGGSLQGLGNATADAQGRYEFKGVIPGQYSIQATAAMGDRAVWAEQRVDFTRVEPEGVTAPDIVLRPSYQIAGKVELVDTKATLESVGTWSVSMRPPGAFVFLPYPQGIIRADGSFELSPANPDLLVVEVNSLPAGHYVKSARMGNMDVLEAGIDLRATPPPGPLEIVVSGKAGTITGIVRDGDKRTVDGASLILLPVKPERQSSRYWVRSAASGTDGRFTLEGLAPGDYKLLAWEELAANAWRNPAVRRAAEDQAKTITVREGEPLNLDVTALPAVR